MTDLSIVIINYNTANLTRACIESVKKYTESISYEIIVVDNASSEKLELEKSSKLKIIRSQKNTGFAGGNNLGIKAAKGKYILLLNSDTYLNSNVLGEMVGWLNKNPRIGIASCKLMNENGTSQTTGGYFPTLGRVLLWMILQDFPLMDGSFRQFHPKHNKAEVYDLDWVGGAFFLMRREVVEKVGLVDEDFFMYVEEVELCFRAKKLGSRVVFNPTWNVTHIGGASSVGSEFSLLSEFKNIKLFYKKHYPAWQMPILRLLLKIGAFGRIILFGILKGKEAARIYAKAFWQV